MGPWETARDNYLAGLSDKEKAMFTSANMENVLAEVTRAEKAHGKNSNTRAFINKIQPLISAIDQYGKALDIISNTSSGILCPLWGSLRILLNISQEFQKYFDKLLEMLQRIGDILPRYSTFALLFKKHTSLQNALASVYLDIITFCMDAKKVFTSSRSTSNHVPSSGLRLLSKLLWKPFDEQFGDVLERFRRHRKLVEDEARLAEMVESTQERVYAGEERAKMSRERDSANEGRETVKEIKAAVDQQVIREMMVGIKNWIAPEFCNEEYERLQDIRLDGSCEWILQKKELGEWKDQSKTQILWIYGIPGCGKTFIFTKLFEDLIKNSASAALFLCMNGDERRNSTSSIIRSWTFQLLEQFPDKIAIANRHRGSKDHTATQKEAMNLLLELLESLPTCYLTMDGLDECNDRKDFIQFLKRIPRKHKVLVVSREQNDIKNLLSIYYHCMVQIKIASVDTNSDIDSYISERLETDFSIEEEDLKIIIRERLLDCQGMFLWVRLMFDHLLMQTTIQELTDALDQLPTGLDETFDTVLKRVNDLPKNQRLLANKIFMWVVTANRPLTIAELRTALAIQPGDQKLDTKKLMINARGAILTLCGPLVEIAEPANTISTIHFTVNQYLMRYLEESRILPEITANYTLNDFESTHSLVAAICVTYLSFSTTGEIIPPSNCYEATALFANQSPDMVFLSYASLNWFLHVKQTSYTDISLRQLVQVFLNPQRLNLETWWPIYWFAGDDSSESKRCPSKFSAMHVAAYFGLEEVIQNLGNENTASALDSYNRTPLWWAVSMKHLPATTALLKLGCDPKAPDNDLITPLHRSVVAAEYYDILCVLLKPGSYTEPIVDAEGWTPLHWAVSRGNDMAIRYYARYTYSRMFILGRLDSTTKDGRTPLHLAALNDHADIIKLLVDSFPRDWDGLHHRRQDCIDAKDHNGLTALHVACKKGHMRSVQTLNYYGANAHICDTAGKTAGQYARLMGYEDIEIYLSRKGRISENEIAPRAEVMLRTGRALAKNGLLETQEGGGNIITANSRDSLDSSALEACINGHYRIISLLRKKGRLFLGRQDHQGRNGLHHAAAGGYEASVKELMEFGMHRRRIDERDINGWTALHYATVGGFLGVVKCLVENGADKSPVNNKGKTPFDIATEEGYRGIVEYLARILKFSFDKLEAAFQWDQLHYYAWSGNLAGIERAIGDARELSPRDRFGQIPLARAAEMGHLDIVQILKDTAPLSVEDTWDSIELAANNGHADNLAFLLQCLPLDGLNSDRKRSLSRRFLFWATRQGNVPIPKRLHELGTSLELQDDSEKMNTVLHIAVEMGHTSLVEFLAENIPDIDAYNAYGLTGLHEAVKSCQAKAITILLHHGADINAKVIEQYYPYSWATDSITGDTPLHVAVQAESAEIVEILLQHGADATILNENGDTALKTARLCLSKLEFSRASPDYIASRQAIMEVFQRYQPQITESIPEKYREPLSAAAAAGDTQAVEALLDLGFSNPDIGQMNYDGSVGPVKDTPLYYAVKGGHTDVVKLILSFSERSYSVIDDSNLDFLADTARKNGHGEVLQILLEKQRSQESIVQNLDSHDYELDYD